MSRPAEYIDSGTRGSDASGPCVGVSGSQRYSASFSIRLRGGAVAACCAAVIGLAWWLSPRPGGSGTHQQLGLPACSFLERTGYPCPTCGLTTSVSAMAHGHFGLAWKSHPFGVVFFTALVTLATAGLAEAVTGRGVLSRLGRPAWWVWMFVIGVPAGWVLRLICGTIDGSLPMR